MHFIKHLFGNPNYFVHVRAAKSSVAIYPFKPWLLQRDRSMLHLEVCVTATIPIEDGNAQTRAIALHRDRGQLEERCHHYTPSVDKLQQ